MASAMDCEYTDPMRPESGAGMSSSSRSSIPKVTRPHKPSLNSGQDRRMPSSQRQGREITERRSQPRSGVGLVSRHNMPSKGCRPEMRVNARSPGRGPRGEFAAGQPKVGVRSPPRSQIRNRLIPEGSNVGSPGSSAAAQQGRRPGDSRQQSSRSRRRSHEHCHDVCRTGCAPHVEHDKGASPIENPRCVCKYHRRVSV